MVVDERDKKVVDALTVLVGQHAADEMPVGAVYGAARAEAGVSDP